MAERGSISIISCVLCLAIAVVAGALVSHIDEVNGTLEADAIAAAAARVGAQELDEGHYLRTGEVRIDPAAAQKKVKAFVAEQAGEDLRVASVVATEGQVKVVLRLATVGVFSKQDSITVNGVASLVEN